MYLFSLRIIDGAVQKQSVKAKKLEKIIRDHIKTWVI